MAENYIVPSESPHSYLVLKENLIFPKGSLVEFKSGSYCYHSHIWIYPHLDELDFKHQEVAPLTEKECVLLDAIGVAAEDDATRFTIYSTPGKLAWGMGLRVGNPVLARLPEKRAAARENLEELYANAVVRSIGVEERNCERALFGVEITVSLVSSRSRGEEGGRGRRASATIGSWRAPLYCRMCY